MNGNDEYAVGDDRQEKWMKGNVRRGTAEEFTSPSHVLVESIS